MYKVGLVGIAIVVMALALVGCGGSNDQATAPGTPTTNLSQTFCVTTNSAGSPIITDQSGVVLNEAQTRAAMTYMQNHSATISLQLAKPQSSEIDTKDFWVGKYFCDIRWDWGYVGGCIQRNCYHINLHIRDTQAQRDVYNNHMCGWWDRGPQFGVYNSASGACAKTTGKFTQIRQAIADSISRAAPMPSWMVQSIAYTTAVVVVVCFAGVGFAF